MLKSMYVTLNFNLMSNKGNNKTISKICHSNFVFINNMLHSFSKSYSKYIYKDKTKRKMTFQRFFRLKFVFLYYIISLNFNISSLFSRAVVVSVCANHCERHYILSNSPPRHPTKTIDT